MPLVPLVASFARRRTIFGLRSQLSATLERPTLREGTDDYFTSWPDDKKKHEISYTRYSPMASLGRHVDEHNEMLKKKEVRRGLTSRIAK